MCGTGISIPRYLARAEGRKREVGEWLVAGASLGAGLQLAFLILAGLFATQLGRWTFGAASTTPLMASLLVATAGLFTHSLACAALRGLSRFQSANALQVANLAVAPLAGVLLARGQASNALFITGALWMAIGGAVFARIWQQWARPLPDARDTRLAFRKLVVFGAPRTPGDVALFGMFALPGYYAAVGRSDLADAGVLSFGMSLVQLVAAVFTAAGLVLLPYWSRASLRNPVGQTRNWITWLLIGSLLFAAGACALLQLWLRPISHLLLGSLADARIPQLRWILAGIIPYTIYLVLRDYLDAVSVFPMTTIALSSALLLELGLLQFTRLSIEAAIVGGFFALGVVTLALWGALLKLPRGGSNTEPPPSGSSAVATELSHSDAF
jgi:O-antigen/teichoic acid export membrane protein